MSIRAFFGFGGPLSGRRIAQSAKLVCNPFAQPEVRMKEMQRLLKDKSTESLAGLLRRFTANAQGHIADEEEKLWLCEALVELGQDAVSPLETYLHGGVKLTYALMAYRRIVAQDVFIRTCHSALDAIGPADYRRTEAKQQLVLAMAEDAQDPTVQRMLAPYLHDHSDDVRWQVLDVIEKSEKRPPSAAVAAMNPWLEGLQSQVTDPHVSARICLRAADIMVAHSWPVGQNLHALHPALENRFHIDKKGLLQSRISA
jgi:hypothetical protein